MRDKPDNSLPLGPGELERLPVGIITLDRGKEVIRINAPARQMLGLDQPGPDKWSDLASGTPLADLAVESPGSHSISVNLDNKNLVVTKSDINNCAGGSVITLVDTTGWDFYWKELARHKEMVNELEDIFNSMYDEIFVIDGHGITRRINKVGESYYGVPVDQLVGKSIWDLEKEGYYTPSASKIVFKEKKRVTLLQKTKGGKQLIVTSNPTFNEKGEIVRVVVNSRDVSELLNLKKRLKDTEKLVETYHKQLLKLSTETTLSTEIVYQSVQMKRVLEVIDKVAHVDSTVLIIGESGVGKGILAKRLHRMSRRADKPFIAINCGAIPEHLMESELFGYEGGAFTGARKEGKKGLLELANNGTVFFDEASTLPLSLQVKLLQVIQERKLIPVGGSVYKDVDIRIVAATNKDLYQMVSEGKFREDLYYRLNVVPVTIPPLRQRHEDIPILVRHFVNQINTKYRLEKNFSQEAVEVLKRYYWPGNVRELENLIEMLMVTTEAGEITPYSLPEYVFASKGQSARRVHVMDICPLKDALEEMERQLFLMAYSRFKSTYKVADALDVNQSTVVRKIHKYKLV